MSDSKQHRAKPEPRVIKEGGYQPTSDPGPVPASLIRAAPAAQAKPSQPRDKKGKAQT